MKFTFFSNIYIICIHAYPKGSLLSFIQEIQGQGIEKSIAFLCMSHDDATGAISLQDNIVDITWERLGFERNFADVNQALEKITAGLRGTFVKNPMWLETLGKSVITAHPLGGCSMGNSGKTAVVNHAGQVFDGS